MKPVIYKIAFADGQSYIGATCNFEARKNTHLRHGSSKKAVNQKLARAFSNNPTPSVFVVACGFSREELHLLEQEVITQENPTCNINTPVPIPAKGTGKIVSFGPFASIAEFARAHGVTYRQAKFAAKTKTYEEFLRPKLRPGTPSKHPPDPRPWMAVTRVGESWVWAKDVKKDKVMKARVITAGGKSLTLTQWSKVSGVSVNTIYQRLHTKWTEAQAVGVEPRPKVIKTKKEKLEKQPRAVKVNLPAKPKKVSLSQKARAAGVPVHLPFSRRKAGWPESTWFDRDAVNPNRECALTKLVEMSKTWKMC